MKRKPIKYNINRNNQIPNAQFGDLLSSGPLAELFKSGQDWNKAWRGDIFAKNSLLNKTIYQNQKDRNADEMYGDPNSPFYDPNYTANVQKAKEESQADYDSQYQSYLKAQEEAQKTGIPLDPREWENINNPQTYVENVQAGNTNVQQYKPKSDAQKLQATAQGIFSGLQYQGAYQQPEPVKLEQGFQGTQWAKYGNQVDSPPKKSIAERYNNPMSLIYTKTTQAYGAQDSGDKYGDYTWSKFDTPRQGIVAATKLLKDKYADYTLEDALKKYSNQGYDASIMKSIPKNKKIKDLNSDEFNTLIKTIGKKEMPASLYKQLAEQDMFNPAYEMNQTAKNIRIIDNTVPRESTMINRPLNINTIQQYRYGGKILKAQTGEYISANQINPSVIPANADTGTFFMADESMGRNSRTNRMYSNNQQGPIKRSTADPMGVIQNLRSLGYLKSFTDEEILSMSPEDQDNLFQAEMNYFNENDPRSTAKRLPGANVVQEVTTPLTATVKEVIEGEPYLSEEEQFEDWYKDQPEGTIQEYKGRKIKIDRSGKGSSKGRGGSYREPGSEERPAPEDKVIIRSGLAKDIYNKRYGGNTYNYYQDGGNVNYTGYTPGTPTSMNPMNIIPGDTVTSTPEQGPPLTSPILTIANFLNKKNAAGTNHGMINILNPGETRQVVGANKMVELPMKETQSQQAKYGSNIKKGRRFGGNISELLNNNSIPNMQFSGLVNPEGAQILSDIYNQDRQYLDQIAGSEQLGPGVSTPEFNRRMLAGRDAAIQAEIKANEEANPYGFNPVSGRAIQIGTTPEQTNPYGFDPATGRAPQVGTLRSDSNKVAADNIKDIYNLKGDKSYEYAKDENGNWVTRKKGSNSDWNIISKTLGSEDKINQAIAELDKNAYKLGSGSSSNSSKASTSESRPYGAQLQNLTSGSKSKSSETTKSRTAPPTSAGTANVLNQYQKLYDPRLQQSSTPVNPNYQPGDEKPVMYGSWEGRMTKGQMRDYQNQRAKETESRMLGLLSMTPEEAASYDQALGFTAAERNVNARNAKLQAEREQNKKSSPRTSYGKPRTPWNENNTTFLGKKVNPTALRAMNRLGLYQYGGEINNDHTFPIHPITEEFTEIQTEKGETVFLPDGTIVDVKADKLHKNMDKDKVTDILPEGSYVFSNDNKMRFKLNETIGGVKIKDMKVGKSVFEYKENEVTTGPQDIMLSDIFNGKDNLTPSDLTRNIKKKFEVRDMKDDFFVSRANAENKGQRVEYLNILKTFSEFKKPKSKREIPKAQYGINLQEGGSIPHAAIGDLIKLSPMYWAGDYFVKQRAEKQNRKLAAERSGIWDKKGEALKQTGAMNMLTNLGTTAAAMNVPDYKYNDYGAEFATTQEAANRARAINQANKYALSQGLATPSSLARYSGSNQNLGNYLAQSTAANAGLLQNAAQQEAQVEIATADALNRYRTAGTDAYNQVANNKMQAMQAATTQGLGNIGRSATDYLSSRGDYQFDRGMDKMAYDQYLEQRKQMARENFENQAKGVFSGIAQVGTMFLPGGGLSGLLGKGAAGAAGGGATSAIGGLTGDPNNPYGFNPATGMGIQFGTPINRPNPFPFTNNTIVPGGTANRYGTNLGFNPFGPR